MVSHRISLIKPQLDTLFKIDFEWWKKNDRNWRVFLRSFLCDEHQALFESLDNDEVVDWVDPKTAEVTQVDGLQHILITHCAKQSNFIQPNMTLVDSVFRVLLSNGNQPMTPLDLGKVLNRQPEMILRTLSGFRVYKGIRPIMEG